ncbi:MAG: hypothetical protein G01um101416_1190 [Microgenomates group bacterium Gr01-1014_16]|nr:MAG: hypothetical protein G01um101416_1190 [Microgenomates group bacterium Gr01-1014_16]
MTQRFPFREDFLVTQYGGKLKLESEEGASENKSDGADE